MESSSDESCQEAPVHPEQLKAGGEWTNPLCGSWIASSVCVRFCSWLPWAGTRTGPPSPRASPVSSRLSFLIYQQSQQHQPMMVGAEQAWLFHAPLGCSSERRFHEKVRSQRVGGHGEDRVSFSATELWKPLSRSIIMGWQKSVAGAVLHTSLSICGRLSWRCGTFDKLSSSSSDTLWGLEERRHYNKLSDVQITGAQVCLENTEIETKCVHRGGHSRLENVTRRQRFCCVFLSLNIKKTAREFSFILFDKGQRKLTFSSNVCVNRRQHEHRSCCELWKSFLKLKALKFIFFPSLSKIGLSHNLMFHHHNHVDKYQHHC